MSTVSHRLALKIPCGIVMFIFSVKVLCDSLKPDKLVECISFVVKKFCRFFKFTSSFASLQSSSLADTLLCFFGRIIGANLSNSGVL